MKVLLRAPAGIAGAANRYGFPLLSGGSGWDFGHTVKSLLYALQNFLNRRSVQLCQRNQIRGTRITFSEYL